MLEKEAFCPFAASQFIKCPVAEACQSLSQNAARGRNSSNFNYSLALEPIKIIGRNFEAWKNASDRVSSSCIVRSKKALEENISLRPVMLISRFLRGPYISSENRKAYEKLILQ